MGSFNHEKEGATRKVGMVFTLVEKGSWRFNHGIRDWLLVLKAIAFDLYNLE